MYPPDEASRAAALAQIAGSVDLSSDADLCRAALVAQRERDQLAVAEARVLVELERRGVTDKTEGQVTAAWVAHHSGRSRRAVARRLADGQVLVEHLPYVLEAVEQGRISIDHAEVLARACNRRIREGFAEVAERLIGLAKEMVFAKWCAHVRDLVRLLDEDGPHDPAGDDLRNKASVHWDFDGSLHFDGKLVGPHAHEFHAALEAETQALFRAWSEDAAACADITVPSLPTLRVLALVELVARGRATIRHAESSEAELSEHDEPAADEPVAEPAADEPVAEPAADEPVAEPAASKPATGAAAPRRRTADLSLPPVRPVSRPTDVVVLVDPNDPIRPYSTRDGVGIDPLSMAALCCDMAVHPLRISEDRVSLELGRERRFASRHQRLVAAARDGGCCYPGCDAPIAWCDLHHIVAWSDGGATDLDNLVHLCRRHHRVTHRKGWKLHIEDDLPVWTTPSGLRMVGQRHGITRRAPLLI